MDLVHSEKKDRFLEAFARCGIVMAAALEAGCHRNCHYNWLKEDADYAERFDEAREAAKDRIDMEIHRRAVLGWDEPVFGTIYNDDGKPIRKDVVGHIRRWSDVLLMFRAKFLRPEYRERSQVNVQTNIDTGGGTIDYDKLVEPVEIYDVVAQEQKRIEQDNGREKGNGDDG